MRFSSCISYILLCVLGLLCKSGFSQNLETILARDELTDIQLIDTLNKISNNLYFEDTKKSRLFAQQALKRAQALDYKHGIGAAYNQIAITYDIEGLRDSAKSYFLRFYEVGKNTGDVKKIGAALNNLGMWHWNGGLFDEALSKYFEALKLAEDNRDQSLQSTALNNIGLIHQELKDHKRALVFHKRALAIRQAEGLSRFVVHSANNLGICYERIHQSDSSQYYYQLGLKLAREINDENSLSKILENLAGLESEKGNQVRALELANEAMQYQDSGLGKMLTNNTLSQIYRRLGDADQCLKYAHTALRLADQLGNMSHRKETYEEMARAFALKNNLDSTVYYYEQLVALKDTLFSQESVEAYNRFEAKYETEKKEQQIALQQAEISEQQAQNQRNSIFIVALVMLVILLVVVSLLIKNRSQKKQAILLQEAQIKLRETQIEAALNSQESERKRFARDLHDGFGQMISVLNLNLKALEKGTSSKEDVFENSSKVLDDMYKELKGICFNLMPETLIKSGVVDAIREFATRVNHTGKVFVEIDSFGIDKRLDDLQEISIYRITQEWINNMLKYSDADKVTVSLTKDEEEITLLIEDNGSGFEKNDLINGNGNGWKNMNSRANLIKGELELDTTAGIRGSSLIVNAPTLIKVPVLV